MIEMQPSLCQRQQLTGALNATDKQRAAVEAGAQAVLDARAKFMIVGDDVRSLTSKPISQSLVTSTPAKSATLADLYHPPAMPPALAQSIHFERRRRGTFVEPVTKRFSTSVRSGIFGVT